MIFTASNYQKGTKSVPAGNNANGSKERAFSLDEVPVEICFAKICAFVHVKDRWTTLTRVSRKWRQLAITSVHNEQHVDLTWCAGDQELDTAAALLCHKRAKRWTRLEAITLYGPRVTGALLKQILLGVGSDQWRQIDLESKQISDSVLMVLGLCTRLHTLSVHCIKLTDRALVSISWACSSLTKVDISRCSRICDDGVIALATNCAALEHLNVSMCHRITDRAVVALALRPNTTLCTLIVDKCLKISGHALRFLLRQQTNLHTLSFSSCPKVQGSDFHTLEAQGVPHCRLAKLNMRGCAALDDASIVALSTLNRSSLMALNISSVPHLTSHTFRAITRCTQLRVLDLSMCHSITNDDLAEIAAS
ncbi:hypothetical protein FI667_g11613, partial [Globisporangium splendens]